MKEIDLQLKVIEEDALRKKVSDYLATFLSEARLRRIAEILDQRTRHVSVIIEDLYQTQNISAVLRTCECYGVQDVHVIENKNEFQVHNAISMGANKWLSIHNYPKSENNLLDCIASLKKNGYIIVATLPSEKSLFLDELPVEDKTAFLFGTELNGLSAKAIELADKSVKINMYGFTESFNISNSVAIILSNFVEKLKKSPVKWQLPAIEKQLLYFEWLQKAVKNSHILVENYLKSNG